MSVDKCLHSDREFPITESDSGINSFNSDVSEVNQILTLESLKDVQGIQTAKESEENSVREVTHSFKLEFQGQYELSRRHTPSMIPWIVECIKLKEQREYVTASIQKSSVSNKMVFKVTSDLVETKLFQEAKGSEIKFEHRIDNLTRFLKNREDCRQFSYLFRHSPDTPFTCFAFQAEDEASVSVDEKILIERKFNLKSFIHQA